MPLEHEFGVTLLNASGCLDGLAAPETARQLDAFVTKTVTPLPRGGNAPVRIAETDVGMLNSIGLANPGRDRFLAETLPVLRELGIPLWVSVGGFAAHEYAETCSQLEDVTIELNLSCPNTECGGMIFGNDAASLGAITRACRRATKLPMWVKLSPNVTDIRETARAAEAEGADAVTLVNTFVGMVVDVERRRPVLANVSGGLSGPAIRPLAVWMTWQVRGAVKIPIVGMGGIMTARDALEFLLAGATAVQTGTVNFVTPSSAVTVARDLSAWLSKRGIGSVREIVGTLDAGRAS